MARSTENQLVIWRHNDKNKDNDKNYWRPVDNAHNKNQYRNFNNLLDTNIHFYTNLLNNAALHRRNSTQLIAFLLNITLYHYYWYQMSHCAIIIVIKCHTMSLLLLLYVKLCHYYCYQMSHCAIIIVITSYCVIITVIKCQIVP